MPPYHSAPFSMDPSCRVQQVSKASSDELLRKFAELDSDEVVVPSKTHEIRIGPVESKKKVAAKIKRQLLQRGVDGAGKRSVGIVDWNIALLPTASRRAPSFIRMVKDATLEPVLDALEKTWRKTIEGASRVLMKKHRGSHVRLASDAV